MIRVDVARHDRDQPTLHNAASEIGRFEVALPVSTFAENAPVVGYL